MKFDEHWRTVLSQQDPDPRYWDDQVKLEHSMRMAEHLIDTRPELAEIWLRSADILRTKIANQGATS